MKKGNIFVLPFTLALFSFITICGQEKGIIFGLKTIHNHLVFMCPTHFAKRLPHIKMYKALLWMSILFELPFTIKWSGQLQYYYFLRSSYWSLNRGYRVMYTPCKLQQGGNNDSKDRRWRSKWTKFCPLGLFHKCPNMCYISFKIFKLCTFYQNMKWR